MKIAPELDNTGHIVITMSVTHLGIRVRAINETNQVPDLDGIYILFGGRRVQVLSNNRC